MADTLTPRRVALITGASDGIGAAIARLMARRGHDVAIVARSRDKLDALAAEIARPGAPAPLVIAQDLGQPGASDTVKAALVTADASVKFLVNNAGFGLVGAIGELDRAEQGAMIDLNVRSLVDLTLLFLPELKANRGRIMQVASVAAFMPGPGMAVYFASKAFVLSFSEAISEELKASGVTVTALCPGATPTGFGVRAGMDMTAMKGMPTTSVEMVAEAGYAGMMAGKRVVIPGAVNILAAGVAALMPRGLMLPAMNRMQFRRTGAKNA